MKINFIWYRIILNIKNIPKELKWLLQRIFKGYDDPYLWNFYSSFAKEIYPKFKAFCEMKKHGLSTCYFDNPDKINYTDKEFEKAFENYDVILNKILFAFEWVLYNDGTCNKKFRKYFEKKYGNPYEKIESNKHEPKKYTIVDEDGNERKEYLLGREPYYYNTEMVEEFYKKAEEGFEFFGKYLFTFWD